MCGSYIRALSQLMDMDMDVSGAGCALIWAGQFSPIHVQVGNMA